MGRLGRLEALRMGSWSWGSGSSPICSCSAEGCGRWFHPSGKKEGWCVPSPGEGWKQHTATLRAAGFPAAGLGKACRCWYRDFLPFPAPSGSYRSIPRCIYPHSSYFKVATAHDTTCKCLEIQLCVLGSPSPGSPPWLYWPGGEGQAGETPVLGDVRYCQKSEKIILPMVNRLWLHQLFPSWYQMY